MSTNGTRLAPAARRSRGRAADRRRPRARAAAAPTAASAGGDPGASDITTPGDLAILMFWADTAQRIQQPGGVDADAGLAADRRLSVKRDLHGLCGIPGSTLSGVLLLLSGTWSKGAVIARNAPMCFDSARQAPPGSAQHASAWVSASASFSSHPPKTCRARRFVHPGRVGWPDVTRRGVRPTKKRPPRLSALAAPRPSRTTSIRSSALGGDPRSRKARSASVNRQLTRRGRNSG